MPDWAPKSQFGRLGARALKTRNSHGQCPNLGVIGARALSAECSGFPQQTCTLLFA